MRAFVAVDLDEAARDAIVVEQRRLGSTIPRASADSLKWVRPDQLHLTLVFLQNVEDVLVPRLVDAMRAEIELPPFRVVFSGLGVFPPRGAPQVLWLAVTSGGVELASVQRVVADRVHAIGLELERRPFHAHLTLARWRRSRPSDAPRAIGAAGRADVAGSAVEHVTFFRSVLSPSGPTHDVLARATLTGCR